MDITTLSGLNTADFKKQIDGKETDLFVLTNKNGMELTVTNYGARIVSILVPDEDGNMVDVVAGHSSIDDYLNSEEIYLGAVCGRYANRIANGKFEIDGEEYTLAQNNGPNSLHGGEKGFHNVIWTMQKGNDNSIILTYFSPDGEEGFPGNLNVTVKYTLIEDKNDILIDYYATTDKPTVINLTNHSYFNLSGAGDPTIADHYLLLNCPYYLPTDETAIPLGTAEATYGTPMDFSRPRKIGEDLNSDYKQISLARGYDHTYIIKRVNDATCVRCISPKTRITLEIDTTEPAVQVYTGNYMQGNQPGKHGKRYPRQSAVCFETQHFPNSPNMPIYPTTLLEPGKQFRSRTVLYFDTLGIY
jgi:aldose 1-epimerase